MSKLSRSRVSLISSAALAALLLAGCSSNGGARLAGVGTPVPGDQSSSGSGDGASAGSGAGDGSGGSGAGSGGSGSGAGGGTGSGGTGGDTGSGSGSGSGSGTGGDGSGTGGTGTGGGGTGTGGGGTGTGGGGTGTGGGGTDGTQTASGLGAVLVTAGNAVLAVGDTVAGVVQPVNEALPATTPITGTIVELDRSTGQALVDAGNGRQVLIDGLRGAVGDAVAITALNTNVTNPADGTSAIGLGVASDTQPTGTIATAGVATAGRLVTATVNGIPGLLVTDATPGAVNQLLALDVGNTTGTATPGTPLVGVAALSNAPANGQLAAVTLLPTNGSGNVANADVPVVGQVVQAVTNPNGGLVGVTAGNTAIGGANPVVAVNLNSSAPATGTVATVNLPVQAAVQSVTGSVLPAVTAAVAPSVNTPVGNVAAPVAAAVTPVTGALVPAVTAVAAPVVNSPVGTVVAPVVATVAPVTNAVLPGVAAAITPAATVATPVATAPAPGAVTGVVGAVTNTVSGVTGAVGGLLGGLGPR